MGILPRFPAAVAELADALDSGSSGSKIPWRFDSSQPHVSAGSEFRSPLFLCGQVMMHTGEPPAVDWLVSLLQVAKKL